MIAPYTQEADLTETDISQQHFTQAVAELGDKQAVVAECAIFNDRGIKIIDKGAAINKTLYERLMSHKLSVPIENCVGSANAVTGNSLRADAEAILDEIPLFSRMAPDSKTRSLLLDALQTIPLPAPIALQLTIARDVRPAIYQHMLRTALTAAWLTKTPLLSRFDVNAAALAGMLHNIGMLHIDPLLLQPEKMLNRDQRRQLYAHPLVSTALIERHHQYPKEVVRAIREHHECLDGSGYPRNLLADAISPLGKIVALSQVVAAMFATPLKGAELRLSVLLRMNTHLYDSTMAMQVIGLLQANINASPPDIEYMAEPIERLLSINDALAQWPATLATQADLTAARRTELQKLATQAAQIHRGLAKVGAGPEQLAQLGDVLDDHVRVEIALVTREAAWQLRTLARQTRRRWQTAVNEAYPDRLKTWLDNVDTVVGKVLGTGVAPEVAHD